MFIIGTLIELIELLKISSDNLIFFLNALKKLLSDIGTESKYLSFGKLFKIKYFCSGANIVL